MDDLTTPFPLRMCRAAWWAIAVPVAAVGVIGAFFLLGPVVALVLLATGSAATAILRHEVSQSGTAPRRTCSLLDSMLGGCAAAAVVGLMAEVGAVGLAVAVMAALAWILPPSVVRWTQDRASTRAEHPGAAGDLPPAELIPADPLPPLSAVQALSTPELCWAWRMSYVRLRGVGCPGYQVRHLAMLRAACLDELERRDPVTFQRWLPTARAAGDPARAFCRRQATGGGV